MTFSSILLIIFFCLIFFNKTSLSNNSISECSITFETTDTNTTCLSSQCSKYFNPLKLLKSSCQINHLKLSFTNYENFLDFIENQIDNEDLLEDFFQENNQQTNTIEIDIDYFNSADNKYFLSFDILLELGGDFGKIHIFKSKIKTWEQTHSNYITFIPQNIVFQQTFQEIHLTFFCNYNSTVVNWILFKQKTIQPNSPCPTQIQIQPTNYLIKSNQITDIKTNQQNNNSIQKKINKTFGISPLKIIIPICLIVLGITYLIYYFIYIPHFRKHVNNYFDNNDIDTSVSELG